LGILTLVAICGLSYTIFTLIPILFHDSPFQTPLTTAAWYFYHLSLRACSIAAQHLLAGFSETVGLATLRTQVYIEILSDRTNRYLKRGMGQTLEDTARQRPWRMDARALAWTLDTIDEDHELEQFMAGVPEFYQSKALTTAKAILGSLSGPNGFNAMLPWKILQVVEHAADDNHHPLDMRQRRSRACLTALYFLPGAVHDILSAFRHASYPPQLEASLPFTLESWSIAAKLSSHLDDDVSLGARCVAAAIATQTTFSDTFRATALREDEGYLPILVRQLGVQEHALHAYLAGNGEDIRLANLVSFVWLTVKFVRNMDVSFKALTATQRNIVLSERERLRAMRFSTTTRSWDAVAGAAGAGADAEAGGAWRAPSSRRISPRLALAVNHDLLRLTLEYLSDPSFYDTPAAEPLHDLREACEYVEDLQRDARFLGRGTHGFGMILEVLRPLREQLFRASSADMGGRELEEKLTAVSIEIGCEDDVPVSATATPMILPSSSEVPLELPLHSSNDLL